MSAIICMLLASYCPTRDLGWEVGPNLTEDGRTMLWECTHWVHRYNPDFGRMAYEYDAIFTFRTKVEAVAKCEALKAMGTMEVMR